MDIAMPSDGRVEEKENNMTNTNTHKWQGKSGTYARRIRCGTNCGWTSGSCDKLGLIAGATKTYPKQFEHLN